MEFVKWLQGKKTYIVAIAGGIVIALKMIGVVDEATAKQILEFLGVSAVITLRAGLKKTNG